MMRMNKTEFKKYCTDYAYLYVIKLTSETETFYKIGITSNIDIHKRIEYYKKYYSYKIIAVYQHTSSDLIMDIERLLIDSFDRYEPNIKFGGSSECVKTIFGINKIFSSLKWIKDLKKIDLSNMKIDKKKKGNFSQHGRAYIEALQAVFSFEKFGHPTADDDYISSKKLIEDIESDAKFDTLVEYIKIFGTKDILSYSDESLKENVLSKKINKHNEQRLLKEVLLSKFKPNDCYTFDEWKDLIQPIYDANKLSGKATTGDLNLAFETSQSSFKRNNKIVGAIKITG